MYYVSDKIHYVREPEMFRLTPTFNIGPHFKTYLSFHLNTHFLNQCTTTAPVWTFNNFWKSERIQTKFRSII